MEDQATSQQSLLAGGALDLYTGWPVCLGLPRNVPTLALTAPHLENPLSPRQMGQLVILTWHQVLALLLKLYEFEHRLHFLMECVLITYIERLVSFRLVVKMLGENSALSLNSGIKALLTSRDSV